MICTKSHKISMIFICLLIVSSTAIWHILFSNSLQDVNVNALHRQISPVNFNQIPGISAYRLNSLDKYWSDYDKLVIGPPENIDWQFGDYYQFRQQNDQNIKYIRQYAEYQLGKARKIWYQKKIIDKNFTYLNQAGSMTIDQNRCPVVKIKPNLEKNMKWKPRKEDTCNLKNDAIFWHATSGTMLGNDIRTNPPYQHWIWNFTLELKKEKMCECPSNVLFIFCDSNTSKDKLRLVEESLKGCNSNCNYVQISQNYSPWNGWGKIGPLIEYVKKNLIILSNKFEYIVMLDATDTTLVRSPHDIVERFNYYNDGNLDILLMGETVGFPTWQHDAKRFEHMVYPWTERQQHLNSGMVMFKINGNRHILDYLNDLEMDFNNFTKEFEKDIKEKGINRWGDQPAFRRLHMKYYPHIMVDTLKKVVSKADIFINEN